MRAKCRDCPFHARGPGRALRRTLAPGRWRAILLGLRLSSRFYCHATTERPRREWRYCRGSLEYQRRFFARPDAGAIVARTFARLLRQHARRPRA